MKIKPEHYMHLKTEITKLLFEKDLNIRALQKRFADDGRTEHALRCALLNAADLSSWICDNLYNYMGDTHLDTAMRRIVKELEHI